MCPASFLFYSLSLHDALPISFCARFCRDCVPWCALQRRRPRSPPSAALPPCPGNLPDPERTTMIDSMLQDTFDQVLHRNPGEPEFHQAVREVFESLEVIQGHHPEYNDRSEEQTSELQSRGHLVCRLLLEKKKNKIDDVRRRLLVQMKPDE